MIDLSKIVPKPSQPKIVGFKVNEPKVRVSPDIELPRKRKKSYDLPRQMPQKEFTFNKIKKVESILKRPQTPQPP